MKEYFDKNLNDIVYHVSDIVKALSVKPLDGYKLLIHFSTGEDKVFDVSPLLEIPAFSELKNAGFFKTAQIQYGTVVWNDDLDLCPESLYNDSMLYQE